MQSALQQLALLRPIENLCQLELQPRQPAEGVGLPQKVNVLLRKIQSRLNQHAQVDQFVGQAMNGFRELTLQRADRRTRGARRCRVDQVGYRLGLGKIELTVQERAATELTRLGETRAEVKATRKQHLHHHRSTVAVGFENVLAGKRARIGKEEQQTTVDRAAIVRQKVRHRRMAGLRLQPAQRKCKGQQVAARDADHADAATT